MNGIQTQVTGRQEATGAGGHALPLSLSLSPSLGNSEAKPEGPNAEGCDVDYWADSDGNEVDPEDVDEEAAGEEED